MAKVAQENTLNEIKKSTDTLTNNKDFFLQVSEGSVDGWSYLRKFGRALSVDTTLTPISASKTYQTPTSAQNLEIVSSSANDTDGGSGAQKVIVIGLNSVWAEIQEEVTMNGVTPVALTNKFIRVYRMYVSLSGSYANCTTPSQLGTINLQGSGGGVVYLSMMLDGSFGLAQSLCGCYTVPLGYTAYVYSGYISTENTKSITAYFFSRSFASDTVSPYDGILKVSTSVDCVGGFSDFGDNHLLGMFDEKTDLGWMAKTSAGTANVSVEFKIYLKKKVVN